MKPIFRVVVLFFLTLMLCFQTSLACSIVVVSLRKEFRQAKDVFLGEIKSVEKDKSTRVTFNVLKSWKGRNEKQLTINSFENCACPSKSFDFVVGKQFLVMTTLVGDDKHLVFEPCFIYTY